MVKVGEGGVLTTDLFCKPTDTHQFLHKTSCHPWHTKKVIPYSQALRYHRICSDDRQFKEHVDKLAGWLKDRGYEESFVNQQINLVKPILSWLNAEFPMACHNSPRPNQNLN